MAWFYFRCGFVTTDAYLARRPSIPWSTSFQHCNLLINLTSTRNTRLFGRLTKRTGSNRRQWHIGYHRGTRNAVTTSATCREDDAAGFSFFPFRKTRDALHISGQITREDPGVIIRKPGENVSNISAASGGTSLGYEITSFSGGPLRDLWKKFFPTGRVTFHGTH